MCDGIYTSIRAQTKLQDKVNTLKIAKQPSTVINPKMFATIESKLDAKLEAMSRTTSAVMDLFHQKFETQKASITTANDHLDARISHIKNFTKKM